MMQNVSDELKICIDLISVGCVSGALMQILPPIAAGLTIVWSLIRIYETETVQRWLGKSDKKDEE